MLDIGDDHSEAHFLGTVWGRVLGKALTKRRLLAGSAIGPFFAMLRRPLLAPGPFALGGRATLGTQLESAVDELVVKEFRPSSFLFFS